jgi:hypothetical protein
MLLENDFDTTTGLAFQTFSNDVRVITQREKTAPRPSTLPSTPKASAPPPTTSPTPCLASQLFIGGQLASHQHEGSRDVTPNGPIFFVWVSTNIQSLSPFL